MASLNEIIRQRKSALREVDRSLKAVDTIVEKSQRQVKRLRSRKVKVPEMSDLERLVVEASKLDNAVTDYSRMLVDAAKAFNP